MHWDSLIGHTGLVDGRADEDQSDGGHPGPRFPLLAELLQRYCSEDLDQVETWKVPTRFGAVFIDVSRKPAAGMSSDDYFDITGGQTPEADRLGPPGTHQSVGATCSVGPVRQAPDFGPSARYQRSCRTRRDDGLSPVPRGHREAQRGRHRCSSLLTGRPGAEACANRWTAGPWRPHARGSHPAVGDRASII